MKVKSGKTKIKIRLFSKHQMCFYKRQYSKIKHLNSKANHLFSQEVDIGRVTGHPIDADYIEATLLHDRAANLESRP